MVARGQSIPAREREIDLVAEASERPSGLQSSQRLEEKRRMEARHHDHESATAGRQRLRASLSAASPGEARDRLARDLGAVELRLVLSAMALGIAPAIVNLEDAIEGAAALQYATRN